MKSRIRLLFACGLITTAAPACAFDILQPLPKQPPIPADNPQSKAKIELGKTLFFDPRLSVEGTLSCNSCHNLAAGGDDDGAAPRAGKTPLERSAPPLWNVAFQTVLFWDGRATSLENQFKEHLTDARVMAMPSGEAMIQRLQTIPGYRDAFARAFPGPSPVSVDNLAKAVAGFERTLLTPGSPFDAYVRGDKEAISVSAKRGLARFDNIGCLSCHFGVNLAGPAPGPAIGMGEGFYELFPNHLGSIYDEKYDLARDIGRYAVTRDARHRYMWRVPPLRNIALTAPYFHNGSVADLGEAVRVMAKTQLKRDLNDQDTADIVAFLTTLTGRFPELTLPRLPDTPGLSLLGGHASR